MLVLPSLFHSLFLFLFTSLLYWCVLFVNSRALYVYFAERITYFRMEMIASHMKLADWKQSSLCQAHEQLHSEASKFLLFSLQWKDLETHFDSTREMIQMQYEELERREKAIARKEEDLDDVKKSINKCSKELELKKNELIELNRLIEKCDGELRLKCW